LASPVGFVSQLLNGVDRRQVIQFSSFKSIVERIGEVSTDQLESFTL